MKKYFVNYEQALVLKELGFDEPCLWFYANNGDDGFVEFLADEKGCKNSDYEEIIIAPLYQQAFTWFRDIYVYVSYIRGRKSMGFEYVLIDVPNNNLKHDTIFSDFIYNTYEEAESACLDKLIKLLQNDKTNKII